MPAAKIKELIGASLPIDYSPLRPFILTSTERAVIDYAEQTIISRCMAEYGLEFQPAPFDQIVANGQADDRTNQGRLYGVTNPAEVEIYGYLSPPLPYDTEVKPPNSADYNRVLQGSSLPGQQINNNPGSFAGKRIPAGGCATQAQSAVEGWKNTTREDVMGNGQSVWAGAATVAQSDPEYRAVEAEWSSCMARSGYAFSSFFAPPESIVNGRSEKSKPSRGEIETARADVACKQKVRVVERLDRVSARYEQIALDSNRRQLEKEKERIDTALMNSMEMISTGNYTVPVRGADTEDK